MPAAARSCSSPGLSTSNCSTFVPGAGRPREDCRATAAAGVSPTGMHAAYQTRAPVPAERAASLLHPRPPIQRFARHVARAHAVHLSARPISRSVCRRRLQRSRRKDGLRQPCWPWPPFSRSPRQYPFCRRQPAVDGLSMAVVRAATRRHHFRRNSRFRVLLRVGLAFSSCDRCRSGKNVRGAAATVAVPQPPVAHQDSFVAAEARPWPGAHPTPVCGLASRLRQDSVWPGSTGDFAGQFC